MARYAVVENGRVINTIVWDPAVSPDWKYDGKGKLVESDTAGIGHAYDGQTFIDDRVEVEGPARLRNAQANAVALISRTFTEITTSLFFEGSVDTLRATAKAGVARIQAATDLAEVETARTETLGAMKA